MVGDVCNDFVWSGGEGGGEHIAVQNRECSIGHCGGEFFEERDKPLIEFDGSDRACMFQQLARQHADSRPDFYDVVILPNVGCSHDCPEYFSIYKKVLSQVFVQFEVVGATELPNFIL